MMRIGHGFDAHRLAPGRKFVVGGIAVPFERGPLGHSDGDVLAHAVADAILGACSLGDLGKHFPSGDERWRDADSLDLLARCVELVHDAGYVIVNVDASVVVERPRLAEFIPQMRERVASALRIPGRDVSIKAKSSDGMGYTGKGKGIAAYAVALIRKAEV